MENALKEPAVAFGKNKFTIEEYLQMEEVAEEKHEYCRVKYLLRQGLKYRKILFR
ncbi:MAG: hypothetical protein ACXWWC_14595 [Chitinophagaceae bacterium]